MTAVTRRRLLSGRPIRIPDSAFPRRWHVPFRNTDLMMASAVIAVPDNHRLRCLAVAGIHADRCARCGSGTRADDGSLSAACLMTDHGACSSAECAADCGFAALVEIRTGGKKRR